MKHYFSFLTIILFISSQFSGYCSDSEGIDEKEKVHSTFRPFKEPRETKTWEELLSSQVSPVSSKEESSSKQIQLRNKTYKEEQEEFIHPEERFTSQGRIDSSDREQFYDKYGVHISFKSNVELKFARDELGEHWNRSYVIPDRILEYIWNLYYKESFIRLEAEIRERDNILKELECNGKSVSEAFFLKEKSYRERIRSLEETIEKGRESLHHIKGDHSSILEDQAEVIKRQKESIQEKRDLEEKALKKIKTILKLLGADETENNILSSLDLLEKLLQK